MDDSIVRACAQLKLTDDEQLAINLEDVVDEVIEEKSELCVVGKLLTKKPYNLNHMRNALASAWRLARGFNLKDVGDNLFVCEFFSKVDKSRILKEGPWHFDKQIILFESLNGNMQPNNMLLTGCPVWVRIYDLPLNCRGKAAVSKIGGRIGRILEWDDEEGVVWNRYSRIRVVIDTSKPLMRGMKVINSLGEHSWIGFKYERIQNYCYWCGMLDHLEVECETKPEQTEVSEWPYGPVLRATPRKRRMMGCRSMPNGSSMNHEGQSSDAMSKSQNTGSVRRSLYMEGEDDNEVGVVNDEERQKGGTENAHVTVSTPEINAIEVVDANLEGLVEVNVNQGDLDLVEGRLHTSGSSRQDKHTGSNGKKKTWTRSKLTRKGVRDSNGGGSKVIPTKRFHHASQEEQDSINLFSKKIRDGLSDKFGGIEISAETAKQSRRTQ
ncbi:uncharacterized protein LOC126678284 [Mercurialis annua]|uniref:uncharacterized protein LOC126678284 n=1 Tax=Mercurialis annua TaxID=3986 RepID=UPI002160EFBF|nr:uncharacterized protein LOC126678284 [Mercurialis annua]